MLFIWINYTENPVQKIKIYISEESRVIVWVLFEFYTIILATSKYWNTSFFSPAHSNYPDCPQSIPKRPSDLFPVPLYSRSMEVRLSPQQQNSLLKTKKERSYKIIENPMPYVWYIVRKGVSAPPFKRGHPLFNRYPLLSILSKSSLLT